MKSRTEFVTAEWKAKANEVRASLDSLAHLVPADETCNVLVVETRENAMIEATVTREAQTMAWSDWRCEAEPSTSTFRYSKTFGPGDPTVKELIAAVRQILTAPKVGRGN